MRAPDKHASLGATHADWCICGALGGTRTPIPTSIPESPRLPESRTTIDATPFRSPPRRPEHDGQGERSLELDRPNRQLALSPDWLQFVASAPMVGSDIPAVEPPGGVVVGA